MLGKIFNDTERRAASLWQLTELSFFVHRKCRILHGRSYSIFNELRSCLLYDAERDLLAIAKFLVVSAKLSIITSMSTDCTCSEECQSALCDAAPFRRQLFISRSIDDGRSTEAASLTGNV